MKAEIILVHGLWFGAWAMRPLARRLAFTGLPVRRFGYHSTRFSLDEHAQRLNEFAQRSDVETRHFVAHSLGGLVTLRMFSLFPETRPGRVVMLGSPLKGSVVARKASHIPGSKALLGEVQQALWKGYPRLRSGHENGVIAGSRSIGLGTLVGAHRMEGDGTVALKETRIGGLTDYIILPVTHTGMLYSKEVARQAVFFIRRGHFQPRDELPDAPRNRVK